ncbi:hypothetical protein S83_027988, partial [Arachis hypogaea]
LKAFIRKLKVLKRRSLVRTEAERKWDKIGYYMSSPNKEKLCLSFLEQLDENELGNWSTLMERHRFLLSALVLLVLLCSVYLYCAVLGASDTCSGLTGPEKASCHMQYLKVYVAKVEIVLGDLKWKHTQ